MSMQNIVQVVKQNRKNALKGINECISWKTLMPKLARRIPGILKNCLYIITAASGIGKTQFSKYAFVLAPVLEALESGLKVQIHYYALEESIEEFQCSILSFFLHRLYGIRVAPIDLIGKYTLPLGEEIMAKVSQCEELMEEIFKFVDIKDHLFTATEIEDDLFKKSLKNGMHYYEKDGNIIPYTEWKDLDYPEEWVHHSYKQDDDTHHIVVVDHISLLEECRNPRTKAVMTHHQTMKYWSFDVSRKLLTKKMNYSVANVQQQVASGEDAQHKKLKMLEPSMSNLADNKLCGRDALVVLGVFNPARYDIKKWGQHQVSDYGDEFRGIIVLKNRKGISSGKIGYHFDGAVNAFKEL